MDADYLRDVADLCLRFLHVVAGIAWIGASFYFIRLDLGLRPPEDEADRGTRRGRRVLGRARRRLLPLAEVPRRAARAARAAALVQVGGVHDVAVRLRAARRPLLAGRRRPARRPVRRRPGAVAGGGALGGGDPARAGGSSTTSPAACSATTLRRGRRRGARVPVGVRGGRSSSPRAPPILQVGAMLGTIMAANVFFVIIPAHWELVRAKQEGREPDPDAGAARQAALGAQQLPDAARSSSRCSPATCRSSSGSDRAWLVLLAIFASSSSRSGTSSTSCTAGRAAVAARRRRRWERSRSRSCSSRTSVDATGRRATTAARAAIVGERCQTCHAAPRRRSASGSRRSTQMRAARGRDRGAGRARARCRPGTRPG